jgi:hypothetical protein
MKLVLLWLIKAAAALQAASPTSEMSAACLLMKNLLMERREAAEVPLWDEVIV